MKPGTLTPDTDLINAVRPFGGDGADANTGISNLADLVGATELATRDAVLGAAMMALAHASKMAVYSDRFPLPADTSRAVLALLEPNDVAVLGETLRNLGRDRRPYQFSAALSTPGAAVFGRTTPIQGTTATTCFRYDLAFSRRNFHARLASTACLHGNRFFNATKGDLK